MRRRTIRFRITALATTVVAAVLVAGGVAAVVLQRRALTAGIDDTLTRRADDIAALVAVTPGPPTALAGPTEEGFAQVVALDGTVVVSTPNLAGEPSIGFDATGTGDTLRTVSGIPVDDDAFRVLSRRLEGSGILYVGRTFDSVGESTAALTVALSIIVPALVVILAAVVWWLVGRTLAPVDQIRGEVAEITSTDLHRRVPEPGSGDEIDRLAATMNSMLGRLESFVERQRRFVADTSHELRSPLTRLRSAIEVELARPGQTMDRDGLEGLLDDTIAMQRLVEDMLYLAAADAGMATVAVAPLDLDDVVMGEGREVQARGWVAVDLSGVSGAEVAGDRRELARAVRNLLDNAERHAASGIVITLQEADGSAVLRIADDGTGVAPEDAERVFERFSRLDESRTAHTGGTGLGLAIARDIVQRHHGTLMVAPSPAPGAVFELRIPLAD